MAVTLPADKFDLELVGAKVSTATKAAEGSPVMGGAGAVFRVPLDNIREIDGFNPRIESPDYLQHIDDLANSIAKEGYYADKPMAGYAAKDGENTVIFLTDGYTRRRALLKLREQGAEVASQPVPIILKPDGQNLEDLTVALVRGNEGRPMSPMEKGIIAKRLVNMGVEPDKIAERLGFTKRYYDDLMLLTGASAKVRNPVIQGKISATEAIKAIRSDPAKAADHVTKAVADATTAGKTKATGKDVKAASGDTSTRKPREPKAAEPAAAAPAAQAMNTVEMSKSSKGGRVIHLISAKFKQGHIAETKTIKPIRTLLDGTFWDYVDANQDKDHVVFNHDLTARIEITVPDADDTFADAATSSVPVSDAAAATAASKDAEADATAGL